MVIEILSDTAVLWAPIYAYGIITYILYNSVISYQCTTTCHCGRVWSFTLNSQPPHYTINFNNDIEHRIPTLIKYHRWFYYNFIHLSHSLSNTSLTNICSFHWHTLLMTMTAFYALFHTNGFLDTTPWLYSNFSYTRIIKWAARQTHPNIFIV